MKKVFIVHGFEGSPNGGWRPWLMAELEKQDVYACALSMPNPGEPVCDEWIEEISRHVELNKNDELYLVGHSLGVPAILRYLESDKALPISGAVLVSGPSERKADNKKLDNFFTAPFDFKRIKSHCRIFSIIHGDNDPFVPLDNAKILARELSGELIVIKNGGHLNGSAGYLKLPECLLSLNNMIN